MSERTVIVRHDSPGAIRTMRIPRACEARSDSYSTRAAESAVRCAASGPGPSTASRRRFIRSVSRERRRTLRRERRDTLGVVRRPAELALQVALDVELLR